VQIQWAAGRQGMRLGHLNMPYLLLPGLASIVNLHFSLFFSRTISTRYCPQFEASKPLTMLHDQCHYALLLLLGQTKCPSWGPTAPSRFISSPLHSSLLIRSSFLIGARTSASCPVPALLLLPHLTPIAGNSVSPFVPQPGPLGRLPTALVLPLPSSALSRDHSDA
jgi:hypothetical protein